jgi:hypothetical protein
MQITEISLKAIDQSLIIKRERARICRSVELLVAAQEAHEEFILFYKRSVAWNEAHKKGELWTTQGHGHETQSIVDNKYIGAYARYAAIFETYRQLNQQSI